MRSSVRVKGSTVIGTVSDFEPGNSYCMVDPDFKWGGLGPNFPFEANLPEIDELVEVSGPERHELCSDFDLMRFDMHSFPFHASCLQLLIERVENGFSISMSSLFSEERLKRFLLEGEDASRLKAEIGKMKAFRWVEPFKLSGVDGHSWALEFYFGNRLFSCSGHNSEPEELTDFIDYVAGL